MPAKYDLKTVRDALHLWLAGNDNKIWFTPRRKSYGAVGFVLGEGDVEAQETIAKGILRLTSRDFFRQLYLTGRDTVADVYGLENCRGHNWYVKFYICAEHETYVAAIISSTG